MNALGHSSNVRGGKTPVTKLDPGHQRHAGHQQALRTIRNKRIRRGERQRLNHTKEIWQ